MRTFLITIFMCINISIFTIAAFAINNEYKKSSMIRSINKMAQDSSNASHKISPSVVIPGDIYDGTLTLTHLPSYKSITNGISDVNTELNEFIGVSCNTNNTLCTGYGIWKGSNNLQDMQIKDESQIWRLYNPKSFFFNQSIESETTCFKPLVLNNTFACVTKNELNQNGISYKLIMVMGDNLLNPYRAPDKIS